MANRLKLSPNTALILSIIAVSTASILIRFAEAPALTVATWRLTLSTMILLPLFLRGSGISKLRVMSRVELLTLLGVGFVLAVHFACWITSLSYTSVSSSVIFVHVDPVFVAIVSHVILRERVSKRIVLGILIAFFGASIIAIGDLSAGEENLIGDLLSLVGAVALGIYILAGRRLRQKLELSTYVTPVYAVSAVVLALASFVTGTPLLGYTVRTYTLFFMIALVPMIFGHTVYNWALRWIPAPIVSISLLGEPVGASILAYIFLGEAPGTLTLFGGVVTLIGILVCTFTTR